MLNLFQKFRRPPCPQNREVRQQFKDYFFSQEEHRWMNQTQKTRAVFEQLLAHLPSSLLVHFMQQPLCFVPSQDYQRHGASRYHSRNTIIVFPKYQELIKSDAAAALAFLAHEIGLVLYETESQADNDPLMAEVEADKFVCDLGLADQLEQFLLAMDECTEKRLRLTYLTIKCLGLN